MNTARTTRPASAAQAAKFTASEGSLGKNVTYNLSADGILTMRVDLNVSQGASASGKSDIIGTTSGNAPIPGGAGAIIGLNLYRKIT